MSTIQGFPLLTL